MQTQAAATDTPPPFPSDEEACRVEGGVWKGGGVPPPAAGALLIGALCRFSPAPGKSTQARLAPLEPAVGTSHQERLKRFPPVGVVWGAGAELDTAVPLIG